MAIAKKPSTQNKPSNNDRVAESFIAGADSKQPKSDRSKVQTTLRFDRDLLTRIDEAAKRRGISRSAWIQYKLSEALESENLL